MVGPSTRLDRIAAVTMIAGSLVLAGEAVMMQLRARRPSPPMYAVGDQVSTIPGVNITAASHTLLLFVRSTCRYCVASADFYKKLLAQAPRVPVVALSFESEPSLLSYLDRFDLHPDRVLVVPPGSLRLSATPALLLVSRTGRVERTWLGQQPPDKEAEILRVVGRPEQ